MTLWSGDYRYQVGPADLTIHPNFNILLTFYYKSITIQIRERIFQCNDCGKDISDNSSDVCFFCNYGVSSDNQQHNIHT